MSCVYFLKFLDEGHRQLRRIPRDEIRTCDLDKTRETFTLSVRLGADNTNLVYISHDLEPSIAHLMFQDLVVDEVDIDVTWTYEQDQWARHENERPHRWLR